jgi:hydrogenase maturation protease
MASQLTSATTSRISARQPRVLVIAYGNPWRGDDGLAWRAANELEAKISSAEVEILRLHQLTPELAENASRADVVIFVDAACAAEDRQPGEIRIQEIRREEASASEQTRFSHHLTPTVILALSAKLYGASAKAFSATLAGKNFEHGATISNEVEAALPEFAAQIEAVARPFLSPEAFPEYSRRP